MAGAGGERVSEMSAGGTLQNVIDNEMASNDRPVACSIPPGVEELISGVQVPDPHRKVGIEGGWVTPRFEKKRLSWYPRCNVDIENPRDHASSLLNSAGRFERFGIDPINERGVWLRNDIESLREHSSSPCTRVLGKFQN